MTTFLLIVVLILGVGSAVLYLLMKRAQAAAALARQQAVDARTTADLEIAQARTAASDAVRFSQESYEKKSAELAVYADQVRQHYETAAQKLYAEMNEKLKAAHAELEPLRAYGYLKDAHAEVSKTLEGAIAEATALRQEAQAVLDEARTSTLAERKAAQQRVREIREQADTLLSQATRDAGRLVTEAEARARKIAGDAYIALRDKETLEEAVNALWNVVNGYGDRFVVPTRSLLDDLAEDFGHTQAGEALRSAREHSQRMVELKEAATCNYEEEDRKERANRFIVDAFNGRVDAILGRTKHDNYGTLAQEIRDAFKLVNLNGVVFRDTRILPAYLDARLAELKWGVTVQELKLKAREEQRRIQEQIREEEKVRREQERAIREAQEKEAVIEEALAKARMEAEQATAQERAGYDARIAELNQRLAEAIVAKQREISLAQLTRAGNVYIISNIGSFGEDVFKIGMTRRRDPMDRIWELSDASVPFEFDVHAIIACDDAPALERTLHQVFDDLRINKVNYRKEFFRIPLQKIREVVIEKGLEAVFTMVAEAREYRETIALAKMTPKDRERFHVQPTTDEVIGDE